MRPLLLLFRKSELFWARLFLRPCLWTWTTRFCPPISTDYCPLLLIAYSSCHSSGMQRVYLLRESEPPCAGSWAGLIANFDPRHLPCHSWLALLICSISWSVQWPPISSTYLLSSARLPFPSSVWATSEFPQFFSQRTWIWTAELPSSAVWSASTAWSPLLRILNPSHQ